MAIIGPPDSGMPFEMAFHSPPSFFADLYIFMSSLARSYLLARLIQMNNVWINRINGKSINVSQTNNLTLILLASSKLIFKEICNSHLFSHIIIDYTISNPFTF